MERDNAVYLHHILDAINQISIYMQDVSEQMFFENRLMQDGVIRQIEIIGEAVRRLSKDLREQYAHIPWRNSRYVRQIDPELFRCGYSSCVADSHTPFVTTQDGNRNHPTRY